MHGVREERRAVDRLDLLRGALRSPSSASPFVAHRRRRRSRSGPPSGARRSSRSMRVAFAPSSQTIGSASSAVFARHQVSATTATVVSFTFTTRRTPGMPAIFASSKLTSLPPNTGQCLDRGVQHAGQLDVDRVDLAAVELVGGVEPLQRLAGDLPVLRILELDALRIGRRQLGRGGGDLAVAGRAARRRRA